MRAYFTRGAVRIIVGIFMVISILFFNLWVTLLGVIVALFYFDNYYEAIAVGILYDMLYGVPLEKFFHIQWATSLVFLFVYFATNRFKHHTRFLKSR
ncbi:MAG: hypothetical protein Q7S11_04285 [bacterium]|nr:hypothetical protein [bacterium]